MNKIVIYPAKNDNGWMAWAVEDTTTGNTLVVGDAKRDVFRVKASVHGLFAADDTYSLATLSEKVNTLNIAEEKIEKEA